MASSLKVEHIEPKMDAGVGRGGRLGMIVLSTDMVTESELAVMTPKTDIAISATRIHMENPVTMENLRKHGGDIGAAAALFTDGDIDVYMYVCTSGTIAIGDDNILKSVRAHSPNAQLTSPMIGAIAGLRALNASKITFLTPYPDEINESMAAYLAEKGVTTLRAGSFHIDDDREIGRVSPQSIVDAAAALDHEDAEAIFVPCASLRMSTIIEEIEERLGKPVVTAHQAMLWHALRLVGYTEPINGFGRLMTI
ncbi:MAG: Asp/Glu racemase [Pseudomonadota bacterium]